MSHHKTASAKRQPTGRLYHELRTASPCVVDGEHCFQCVLANGAATLAVNVPAAALTNYRDFKRAVAGAAGVAMFNRICESHPETWQYAVESAMEGQR
jgi:hypothetical protein